jgi:hypothetical protein
LSIEPTGDIDWFEITCGTGGLYIELIHYSFFSNFDLELYDSQGSFIQGSYRYGGYDEDIYINVPEGTYYLKVFAGTANYDWYGSSYDLYIVTSLSDSAPFTPQDDQFEENDSFATAHSFGVISGNRIENNLVILRDDNDWYQFTMNGTGVAGNQVVITFDGSIGDLDLQLYDSNQNLINGSYSVSNSESINLLGLNAGDYYVRVYGYSGSENPNYTLTINTPVSGGTTITDDQFEDNDTFSTATNADTIPGFNNGVLTVNDLVIVPDDDDWFYFQLGNALPNSEVSIRFDHSLGDLDLELYDRYRNLIGISNGESGTESLSLWGLNSGQEYYIRVFGYAEAGNPNYSFTINDPPEVSDPEDDRFESNDNFDDATVLGNQSRAENGLVILPENPDYFQFELTQTGTVNDQILVNFSHTLGDLDINLYDGNRNYLTGSYGVDDYELISLAGLSPGTYYAQVYGWSGTSNPDYSISLTLSSGTSTLRNDRFEENNTRETATDLRDLQGENPFGDLVILSGDEDWFKFNMLAPGSIGNYIQVDFSHAVGDIDIELFDANNTYVGGSFNVTDGEYISLAGLSAGQYYLQVYGYNNAQNPDYSLTINTPSVGSVNPDDPTPTIGPDAYESNDTQEEATPISASLEIRDLTIHAPNNDDWFVFTLAQDGRIGDRVRIDYNYAQGDIDLQLLDSQNNFAIRQSQGVSNTEVISLEGLIEGTYYARVYGFNEATNPNYNLSVIADLIISDEVTPEILDDRFEENDTQLPSEDGSLRGAYDFGQIRGSRFEDNLVVLNDDWYKFTTTSSGGVEVEIDFQHNQGDLDLLIIDPNNISFRSQRVTNGEAITIPNATPGEFFIKVSGYDSGDGPATNPNYTLSITAPNLTTVEVEGQQQQLINPDYLEVNNDVATATVIRENNFTAENLTIHNSSDQDWFMFTTQAVGSQGNQILIQYEKTQGELDLILLDESGNPLSNYGSNFTDNPSGIDTEIISLGELPQGTYYAQVAGVDNATNPGYSLSFNAPVQQIINTTTSGATWTILVYIAGDNDLDASALKDINEMESVDLPSNVNVVVQVDRSAEHNVLGEGDWHDTRRGVIRRDYDFNTVTSPLESIGEKNMGSAETLKEFIQWGTENYEAQNYAVVLWNHGGGLPGVAWDEDPEANNDNLTVAEVTQAITDSGVQFRLVGFDACLQGLIEQGYDLKDVTDYVVHSQDLEPGDGWDYEGLLQQLASNPNMTPEQLASAIVETYGGFYDRNQTQSAVNASFYEELAQKIDTFAQTVLTQANANDWNRITQAIYATPFYYDRSYRDLGVFMETVERGVTDSPIATAAGVVKDAVRNAVISNIDVRDASGVSVYLPPANSSVINSYSEENFSFLADTAWEDFLTGYTSRGSANVARNNRILPDFAEATERTGRSTVRTNNDTRSQAYDLGSLSGPGNVYRNLTITLLDIDWYRFEIPVQSTSDEHNVQIIFDHLLGDLKIGLYDGDGNLILESNTSTDNNGQEQVTLNGLAPSQYFIKVEGIDGQTVSSPDYQLIVNAPQTRTGATVSIPTDWAGRNNTPEQATQLGSISYGEEIRLVGLNINEQDYGRNVVPTLPDPSSSDPQTFAFDAFGEAGDWFVYRPSRITDLNPNAVSLSFDNAQGNLDLYVYEQLPDGQLSFMGGSTSEDNEEYFSFGETNNLVFIQVIGKDKVTNPNYELRIARRQFDVNGDGVVNLIDLRLGLDTLNNPTRPSVIQNNADSRGYFTPGSGRTFGEEILNYLDSDTIAQMLDVNGDGISDLIDLRLTLDAINNPNRPQVVENNAVSRGYFTPGSTRTTGQEIIDFVQQFMPDTNSRNFGDNSNPTNVRSSSFSNDLLGQSFFGNQANNEFIGTDKNDTFYSGTGDEILTGGLGADTFVFGINNGNDRITDFSPSEDYIRIVNSISLGFNSSEDVFNALIQGNEEGTYRLALGDGRVDIVSDQSLSANNFVLV